MHQLGLVPIVCFPRHGEVWVHTEPPNHISTPKLGWKFDDAKLLFVVDDDFWHEGSVLGFVA